jgi:hypothetical protein
MVSPCSCEEGSCEEEPSAARNHQARRARIDAFPRIFAKGIKNSREIVEGDIFRKVSPSQKQGTFGGFPSKGMFFTFFCAHGRLYCSATLFWET